MREFRTPGSVRGVLGNGHLYRDCFYVQIQWQAFPVSADGSRSLFSTP